MSEETNDQLVLISGESASGKSASLRNIRHQQRWIYINCEAGKRLPFKNEFIQARIHDPWEVYSIVDDAIANSDQVDGLIIDTSTYLMDMFESQYIYNSVNSQKAWGDYAQFWKNLLQQKIVQFGKPVIILAHTKRELDEVAGQFVTAVPVKGALKNNGIESYFSTVVSTKKVPLKELEEYGTNAMLHVSEEEEALGYKHVFQTRLTKKTIGERIRSPMGMFSKEETYIDNDAQQLVDHLIDFYK